MTATLLFVHSPVLGPSTWRATANILQRKGFRCEVPDLTGVTAVDPPFYPKFADVAAEALHDSGVDPVVLIGHSAAGSLIPAIGDVLSGRVTGAVFVDATLPHPGLSWFDAAPAPLRDQLLGMADDGLLPPWHEWSPPGAIEELIPDPTVRQAFFAEIPRLPVAYFDEPAPMTRDLDAYAVLRFSAAYDDAADEAERRGGWVARRDWDHLRMLRDPEPVADLIAQAISATHPE
jgi:pimeloyl-ACP methyl ester carboxylesterase